MIYAIMTCYVLAAAPDRPEQCTVGVVVGDRKQCIQSAAEIPATRQGRGYTRYECDELNVGQWRPVAAD